MSQPGYPARGTTSEVSPSGVASAHLWQSRLGRRASFAATAWGGPAGQPSAAFELKGELPPHALSKLHEVYRQERERIIRSGVQSTRSRAPGRGRVGFEHALHDQCPSLEGRNGDGPRTVRVDLKGLLAAQARHRGRRTAMLGDLVDDE